MAEGLPFEGPLTWPGRLARTHGVNEYTRADATYTKIVNPKSRPRK